MVVQEYEEKNVIYSVGDARKSLSLSKPYKNRQNRSAGLFTGFPLLLRCVIVVHQLHL